MYFACKKKLIGPSFSTSSLVATNGSTSPIPAQPMVNGTDKKETSPLSSGASTSKYSFTGASFGDGGVSDKVT